MKHCILVIEDNVMMRKFLSNLLGKKYKVVVKESAEKALAWLDQKNSPDLIISDYELDGISGFDLLERLQLFEAYENTPFLLISGRFNKENHTRCLKAGAVDFIVKPFDPVELELKVSQIIQDRAQSLGLYS